VEGTNKLLLYILARLCAPELGEDGWQVAEWETLPRTWPDHFERAIRILNWRVLPALKFSPKELLLGLVVNTSKSPLEASSSLLPPSDIDTHMLYVEQQRLDGYAESVHHAIQRKATFDRKVLKSKAGPVAFGRGQLVQVYRSDLANTLSTEKKLAPRWSEPRRITERLTNSYKLATLEGKNMEGEFSARRLREFVPREGTELSQNQKELTTKIEEEDKEYQQLEKGEVDRRKKEENNVQDKEVRRTGGLTEQEAKDWESNNTSNIEEDQDQEAEKTQEVDEENGETEGFFYEEEVDEEEEEDVGIGGRVAGRRGRRHS
jgi:hypothetical protein